MFKGHPTLDGLIVLGSRLNPQEKPGRVARLRLLHALKIWNEHCPKAQILITGGYTGGAAISEARAMAHWSLAWVEENWGSEIKERLAPCLILEEASRNTLASVHHTLPLIINLKWQVVGLVSDILHIRRAHYLFKRHFSPHRITLHPLPVSGVLKHYWKQRRFLWLSKMALREGGAWLKVLGRRVVRK
ncbi:MAG: YdcF family protein [Desulfobaccales bacterium]|nr:YdcF family protein [Desulfobaccales bacterium]